MAWLIVAMGVLLMLVGAVSVISGAPIIQIERGWAEVIAGSVSVSGGAVTFALGVVLFRLQNWQSAALGQAPAERPVVRPEVQVRTESALRPTLAPEQPLESLDTAPAVAFRETGSTGSDHPTLWRPVSDSEQTIAAHDDDAISAAAEPATAGVAPDQSSPEIATSTVTAEAEPPASADISPSDDAASRRPSYPRPDRPAALEPKRATSFSRDWMSRPLLRSRSPQAPASEPPPLFAGPPADQDEGQAPAVEAPRLVEDAEPHVALVPSRSATPEPFETTAKGAPPAELAVVGRYQAGASTYTMFSNGAIEVETEGGDIHRFGSMGELKAFIARQENAVS